LPLLRLLQHGALVAGDLPAEALALQLLQAWVMR
jgi:hypothetical protein